MAASCVYYRLGYLRYGDLGALKDLSAEHLAV